MQLARLHARSADFRGLRLRFVSFRFRGSRRSCLRLLSLPGLASLVLSIRGDRVRDLLRRRLRFAPLVPATHLAAAHRRASQSAFGGVVQGACESYTGVRVLRRLAVALVAAPPRTCRFELRKAARVGGSDERRSNGPGTRP